MSLSTEYCCAGDRGGGGGAISHQRRLIVGLVVWATLLTLGLAASITLHFIPKESPAPSTPQAPIKIIQEKAKNIGLMTFKASSNNNDKVGLIQWDTMHASFIEGDKDLKVMETGLYFLYLQVTLEAPPSGNQTINVQTEKRSVILKGSINGSNNSTGFLGTGISLEKGDTFNVTCKPGAKIKKSPLDTYLGVIKIKSD